MAISTPTNIARRALLKSIPNRYATILPVQAPVPGIGIATKTAKPINPYFLTVTLALYLRFFMYLTKTLLIRLCSPLLIIHFSMLFMAKSKNGTGAILPKNESISVQGRSIPLAIP